MSPITTIAKREFRSYFDSPLAYVVICLSFLGLGLAFFMYAKYWDLDQATMRQLFGYVPVGLGLLVVPVVTMRLLAEERRSGTLEMLITLPVRDSDVILGKYLGALGLVLTLTLATLIYPIAMFVWPWQLGPLDWGPVWSGYLGMALFSAAAVAIGLLISSLTSSQAVAFFITFFVFLVLWFMGNVTQGFPSALGDPLTYLSLQTRVADFTRGLIALRDVVYFLSVVVLALVMAFRALERRKWT
jgi:ABC-2 type transport system permease protein